MSVAYWIIASLLALFYLYAGGIKVVRSKDQLRPMMGWIDAVPLRLVRTIGVLEVLGALGLILPPLIGIAAGLALAGADTSDSHHGTGVDRSGRKIGAAAAR